MKRQFIIIIDSQYKEEIDFDDLVNLCLLRVSGVKLELEAEKNTKSELILSEKEIIKFKKIIAEKIEVIPLSDGRIKCFIEIDF